MTKEEINAKFAKLTGAEKLETIRQIKENRKNAKKALQKLANPYYSRGKGKIGGGTIPKIKNTNKFK